MVWTHTEDKPLKFQKDNQNKNYVIKSVSVILILQKESNYQNLKSQKNHVDILKLLSAAQMVKRVKLSKREF